MSTLTHNERDGLEEVFMSIHNGDKYFKLKKLSALIISHQATFNPRKLLKQAKHGLKETNLSQLLHSLSKKKKNLSK